MNERATQACRSGTPVPDTMFPAPGAISDAERLDGVRMSMISARKTFAEHWALDPTGNWTGYKQDTDGDGVWDLDQTRTHNAANEITGHAELADPVENAWATPAYDRAGNMTTVPKPNLPTSSYQCIYDAWNRLVRVRDGKKTVAEYQYDGRNFRVVKKTYDDGVFSEVRHFYYTNDWQVLEERASDTLTSDPRTLAPAAQFVWGQRYIDDLILRDRDTNADGTLDERLYALQDANWNVVALADTTGEIVERYGYSSYGTPVFLDSFHNSRVSSLYDWDILYCGYRWDNHSQKFQVRYRNLWSHLGCWDRRDPVGYRGGINLYKYVSNNPVMRTDPSGMDFSMYCPAAYPKSSNWTSRTRHGGKIPGHKGKWQENGYCTNAAQFAAIAKAVGSACDCFDKAAYLLENYTAAIDDYFSQAVTDIKYMRIAENRAKMLKFFGNVQKACESGTVPFECESCCNSKTETVLYTYFLTGTNWVIGSVMHISPNFFTSGDKAADMMHEMGRFYNGMGEDFTKTWNDVTLWDNVLRGLCDNYVFITNKYAKD